MHPREKVDLYGMDGLQSWELICLILGSGSKQRSIFELAPELETYFLSHTEPTLQDLCLFPGLGLIKAKQLLAAWEFGKRSIEQYQQHRICITTQEDVVRTCHTLAHEKKEHVIALLLNGHKELLGKETISIGTVSESLIHPREAFAEAINRRASSIIFVHNHPSGLVEASEADISVTKRLIDAGRILGIEVLDHIIITKNGWCSVPGEYHPHAGLSKVD